MAESDPGMEERRDPSDRQIPHDFLLLEHQQQVPTDPISIDLPLPAPLFRASRDHAGRLLAKMGSLRRERQLCDVTLRVGHREIAAHRLVLSACSQYFCAMFTNRMRESEQESVTLADVDADCLEEIVDFAYTGNISIHEDNVQHLLKASAMLQLSEIVSACCTFLKGQLHATNCLGIATFAKAHGCISLGDRAMEYVQDSFAEVVEGEEFLQLSLDSVLNLLGSDLIQVSSEECVFEAMYKWLTHDLVTRKPHALSLLNCIRLPLLPPLYLSDVVYAKEIFKEDPACLQEIMNALVYVSVKEKQPHLKDIVNCRPRKSTLGTMFVVGGIDTGRNKTSVEVFDARREIWVLLGYPQLMFKRLQFGVAVLGSHVYVVGGRNGLQTLNTVDCFNPVNNSWLPVPPMCSYRHGVGVATLCGPLYAVGGHDGWSYLSSVQR